MMLTISRIVYVASPKSLSSLPRKEDPFSWKRNIPITALEKEYGKKALSLMIFPLLICMGT